MGVRRYWAREYETSVRSHGHGWLPAGVRAGRQSWTQRMAEAPADESAQVAGRRRVESPSDGRMAYALLMVAHRPPLKGAARPSRETTRCRSSLTPPWWAAGPRAAHAAPSIHQHTQFDVPLSEWTQCAECAGESSEMNRGLTLATEISRNRQYDAPCPCAEESAE